MRTYYLLHSRRCVGFVFLRPILGRKTTKHILGRKTTNILGFILGRKTTNLF